VPDFEAGSLAMSWAFVLSEEDWEAQLLSWHSPLHLLCEGHDARICVAKTTGLPMSLLQAAARLAFHDLPLATIHKLGHRLKLGSVGDHSIYDQVEQLVRNSLPLISDATMLDIMRKRVKQDTISTTDMLSAPDIVAVFGDDEEEVKKSYETRERDSVTMQPYKNKLKILASKVREATAATLPKSRRRGTAPATINDDELFTESAARNFAPSTCKVYKDFFNARWLATTSGSSRSRSWALYGETKALALVLLWAWEVHSSLHGESCPFGWIRKQAEAA
jgi:hypothetical protein